MSLNLLCIASNGVIISYEEVKGQTIRYGFENHGTFVGGDSDTYIISPDT